MKKIKNLLLIILGVLSIGFITTSCNDTFSEKDLLELQIQLGSEQDSLNAVRQLAALNAAGELVSFQVKVVDTDGVGVAGLEVTLGAASADGTPDNQTLTTDANGGVYFNRVAIGGNNLDITGAGIMDALLTLDFGRLQNGVNYQIINGNVIPIPVVENAVVTVLGAAASTATVQGKAIIETDVTNTTPEFPQDVVIRADFNDNLVVASSIGINYFFATNDNVMDVGVATVDNATGAYSMSVPAGVRFDVIIPNVQTSQRVAVNSVNSQMLPRPEYQDIATNFGPSYGTDYNTPSVVGAWVVVDAPPVPGDGFTFGGFTPIGRTLDNIDVFYNYAITTPYQTANTIFQFTNLGSGYQSSPAVAIAGGGTGATAEYYLRYTVSSVAVTTKATGYANDTDYTMSVFYTDVNDVNNSSIGFTVTSSATGEITQTEIDAGIAAANTANNIIGFGDNPKSIGEFSKGMTIEFPAGGAGDGVATITIDGSLYRFRVTDGGKDYTSPTFTFSGGGTGATQAVLNVIEFGTQWTVDVDNSNISSPYPLLPQSMSLEYNPITTSTSFVSTSSQAQNSSGSNNSFFSLLTIDGSGDLQWVDQTTSYRTTFFASMAPRPIIVQNTASTADMRISSGNIGSVDGEITGLGLYASGDGYTSRFNFVIEPSATGAPGSGATAEISGGYTATSGEYIWQYGYNLLNKGGGYLRNLNQVNGDRNFSAPNTTYIKLRAGDTRILDIDYGTGVRTVNIN